MNVAEAMARDNGIDFFVNKRNITVSVIRDESGEIKVLRTNGIKQKLPIKASNILVSVITATICGVYVGLKKDTGDWRMDAIVYLGIAWITVFVKFITESLSPKNKQLYRYHAAEHKVLNFWEKYQRLPFDSQEVMSMNSISLMCGSTVVTVYLVWITLCVLGIVLIPSIIFKIIWCIFSAIVTSILWRVGGCNFFQKMVIREPSIREIEVAVEGLSVYVREKCKE